MQLSEVTFGDQPPVDGYGPGFFRVQGQVHKGGMLLSKAGVTDWAGLSDLAPIVGCREHFDILFVGTGAQIVPLPTELRNGFDEAGIATEVMASPSACRTYNVLLAEGLRLALAVVPI